VQHHFADVSSVLADAGWPRDSVAVLGVALDGLGYVDDGSIWGGEFLLADYKDFKRVGHFEYMPLPGGVVAIKKPYRLALSYLYSLLGDDFSLDGLPLGDIKPAEIEIIKQQLKQKINSPLASSAGRLFDAVSALAGVRGEIDYEAQAAIELEMLAPDKINKAGSYPFSIEGEGGMRVVKLRELLAAVVADVRNKVTVAEISLKFHYTVANIIIEMCKLIADDSKIKRVGLSGGVFQNRLLLKLATAALKREGFEVFTHRLVPANDGGISLGQAVVANFARI